MMRGLGRVDPMPPGIFLLTKFWEISMTHEELEEHINSLLDDVAGMKCDMRSAEYDIDGLKDDVAKLEEEA